MIYRLLVISFMVFMSWNSYAQKRVFISYTVPVFVDDFKKPDKTWPIIKSSEMYSAYDNGDYYIIRKNPVTPYVLMADWPNSIEKFHLKTAVKIAPGFGKDQSIGVVMMASNNGKEGLIIDINRFRDYRIRRIENGKYIYITGKEENDGWESSGNLHSKDEQNIIEVKTDNGEYDLFFNGDYITSFSAHELFTGNFGIYVGPDTKARVNYFHVVSVRNTEGNTSVAGTNYAELLEKTLSENNELKKLLKEQKDKITELTIENPTETTQLKNAISLMEEQLRESNSRIKLMEKNLIELNNANYRLDTENHEFQLKIDTLEKQLSIARGDSAVRIIKGSSTDQVIQLLTRSLEDEINRNDIKTNELNVLQKQYNELNDQFKEFKRLLLEYMKSESMANMNKVKEYALLPFDLKPILNPTSPLMESGSKASENMAKALEHVDNEQPAFVAPKQNEKELSPNKKQDKPVEKFKHYIRKPLPVKKAKKRE